MKIKVERGNTLIMQTQRGTYLNHFNFNIKLLGYIAAGFEVTCVIIIATLFYFAWHFDDPQSLVIPSVLAIFVLPTLDMARRFIAKGNVSAAVTVTCIVSWIAALTIGFFASVVPVIFAASAVLSFVPVIIATTTTTHRTLLIVSSLSILVCCICSVFLVLPPFLSEGVPAIVIGNLIAIIVPLLLGISSISLWYGNRRLQLSLTEALQANDTLAAKHQLEIELEEQKRMEADARHDAERADLEKLRYQINPHFLFNSLTSIRGAIRTNSTTAREMITVLAEFCRLTLMRGSTEIHQLSEELETLYLYLKMEQARSGDNLQVEVSVDPALKTFLMPAFVLQPLIENAIKYGRQTSTLTQGDTLQIAVMITGDADSSLHIRVSNTGCWVDSTLEGPIPSTRTGLRNLRQRLIRHYDNTIQLEHREENEEVHVTVLLPFSLKQVK